MGDGNVDSWCSQPWVQLDTTDGGGGVVTLIVCVDS